MRLDWPGHSKTVLLRELHHIVSLLRKRGGFRRAAAACRLILFFDPKNKGTLEHLSEISMITGHPLLALAELGELLAIEPNNPGYMLATANAYSALGETEKSLGILEVALEHDGDNVSCLVAQAILLHRVNRIEESIAAWRRVLSVAPELPDVYHMLGTALVDAACVDEAVEVFERGTRVAPSAPFCYFCLARLEYYRTHLDTAAQHAFAIEDLLMNAIIASPEIVERFQYTLAEVYESLGRWQDSFRCIEAANQAKREKMISMSRRKGFSFKPKTLRRAYDDLLNASKLVFTSRFIQSLATNHDRMNMSPKMVFVIGMPRSGSSLVEQILASHPDVATGGEGYDMEMLVRQLPRFLSTKKPYPRCAGLLTVQNTEIAAGAFATTIRERCCGKTCYVDKTLANFWYLGLIICLFPHAKIVHCVRNPMDTCLSCYFQDFVDPVFAYLFTDLESTEWFYKQYRAIMDYWATVVPCPILEIRYEELVANTEDQVNRLLDYCEPLAADLLPGILQDQQESYDRKCPAGEEADLRNLG